ncbi:hypothetical protein COS33_00285 [Candidatus Wolfebacteria bacterium CG02_land_8_20_14_3_00_37_12]|uniref:Laccase domain-containing protein n=3 Tax=Parcubacteria group TaxID=1794811 RepID=A0A2M7Q814_9BACT|nr:MAG: hypothetical protein COS49_02235 [Candidatus Portnoybacteria bacterium CG03_land_8_20_14_0_80_41_10]PIV31986.1 MAG: hypothetical protein COS33_00285 [Candidatus Wolfebacteria bacterium CG02_land_8_20_14_3_00_37_12]PIY59591.1 MAG: hypothetical protein COY96_00935 [Candidatus Wolfebacteria bacterium CG_4_10_14_0_8_um_filter_37_11]
MDRQFIFRQLGGNSFAGMTLRVAGNFYPDGSFDKAFEVADRALAISGFNQTEYIIMRVEEHGNNIWFFEEIKKREAYQIFCDGVIYRGTGAAVFFPGGCPAIAFHDEAIGISGMLHGGWKSIAQGVVKNFLHKWEDAGGLPNTTQIEFLPSICSNCLKFDNDYFKKVSAAMAPIKAYMFARRRNERYVSFNLLKLIEILINGFGYKVENNTDCVCCSGNHWCYRCDDKNGRKYRNAAFIISR